MRYLIFITGIFLFSSCKASGYVGDCSLKLSKSQDEIKAAFEKHPLRPEPFVCQLAMSLDDPNTSERTYANCVNKLLYQYVKVEPLAMRNQNNWVKMTKAVKDKNVAQGLYECSKMLQDCIDVENVYHCLKYSSVTYKHTDKENASTGKGRIY